jgi:hypothetical protein
LPVETVRTEGVQGASMRLWRLLQSAWNGRKASPAHAVPLVDYPIDIAELILDLLSPEDLQTVSQVDRRHRCLVIPRVMAELADDGHRLPLVRSILGGILAWPIEQQVLPMRALNGAARFIESDEERAQAKLLLTQPTLACGDAEALEYLTRMYRVPAGDEGVDAMRRVWAQACTPPLDEKAGALYWLRRQVGVFPVEERQQRFVEHLSAWEQLVADKREFFLDHPIDAPATPTYASGGLICWDLHDMLEWWMPESFQEEGKRRIRQLGEEIHAVRRAAGQA